MKIDRIVNSIKFHLVRLDEPQCILGGCMIHPLISNRNSVVRNSAELFLYCAEFTRKF